MIVTKQFKKGAKELLGNKSKFEFLKLILIICRLKLLDQTVKAASFSLGLLIIGGSINYLAKKNEKK